MELFGYLASIIMGVTLGLIGGGGSILTVPILVYLFNTNPITATAYSLFIVGSTALVGGLSYLKKGEVDLKTGFTFAVPSFIGVYLTRAYLMPSLPDPVFSLGSYVVTKPLLVMVVFAVLMLAASVSMIKTPTKKTTKLVLSHRTKMALIGIEGLVVGVVTGFVGAGGGFLIIPALVILVGMPMKIAVGTSLFIIAAKSLIGFLGDLQHQTHIQWNLMFSITVLAIGGLFIGMLLSKKVSEKGLKKGFGYFVLIMGSFILFDQLNR